MNELNPGSNPTSENLSDEARTGGLLYSGEIMVTPDSEEENVFWFSFRRPWEEGQRGDVFLPAGSEIRIQEDEMLHYLNDLDAQHNPPGRGGYRRIAHVVWIWGRTVLTHSTLSRETTGSAAIGWRLAVSLARCTDAAYAGWDSTMQFLEEADEDFVWQLRTYQALAMAEMTVIALHRSFRVLDRLAHYNMISPPPAVSGISTAVRHIRNAFEHIEERAAGTVQRRECETALTIFDQPDFLTSGTIQYGDHSLNLNSQVPDSLLACREFVREALENMAPDCVVPPFDAGS